MPRTLNQLSAMGVLAGGRQPWDIARFTRTVMFFNEMPSPGQMLTSFLEQPLKLFRSIMSPQDVEVGATFAMLPKLHHPCLWDGSIAAVNFFVWLRVSVQVTAQASEY